MQITSPRLWPVKFCSNIMNPAQCVLGLSLPLLSLASLPPSLPLLSFTSCVSLLLPQNLSLSLSLSYFLRPPLSLSSFSFSPPSSGSPFRSLPAFLCPWVEEMLPYCSSSAAACCDMGFRAKASNVPWKWIYSYWGGVCSTESTVQAQRALFKLNVCFCRFKTVLSIISTGLCIYCLCVLCVYAVCVCVCIYTVCV